MRYSPLGLAIWLCAAGLAQAQDVEEGRNLFNDICAVCHGLDAMGDGPMAPVLTIAPPDLTALQAANDGVFPRVKVVFQIDGRDPMIAHGGPMPVFGPYLEGGGSAALSAADGTPILTSPAIADLVSYLESIQS